MVPPSLSICLTIAKAATGRERCSRTKQTKTWSKDSALKGKAKMSACRNSTLVSPARSALRLASAIESAETSTDVNRASGLRWARVTVVAAALAVALAAPLLQRPATVTHGPGTSVQPPGSIGRTEPTAVKVLAEAALASARAPAPGFGPGRYWYVLERGVKLGTSSDKAGSKDSVFYRFGYERETWWALGGSLSGHLRSGRAEFLDSTERAAWIAAGRPDLGLPNTEVYSPKAK